jgi:hypothetical protein
MFAVHPDTVISKTDGQWHYVSAPSLAHLYHLNPTEWVTWDDAKSEFAGRSDRTQYMHLYVLYDGSYEAWQVAIRRHRGE